MIFSSLLNIARNASLLLGAATTTGDAWVTTGGGVIVAVDVVAVEVSGALTTGVLGVDAIGVGVGTMIGAGGGVGRAMQEYVTT
jgi:hypothetical protein